MKKLQKRDMRMGDEEYQAVVNKAKVLGENFSSYSRRVLNESVAYAIYTRKDVTELLYQVGYYMAVCDESNFNEVKEKINRLGAQICQILS